MSKARINICIPTYKRTRFLIDLIKSINASWECYKAQSHDNRLSLKVFIIDNDSESNNLFHIKFKFPLLLPHLTYQVNSANIGIERNILKAIEYGLLDSHPHEYSYIWTIGDDDLVSNRAFIDIERAIFEEESSLPALIICSESPSCCPLELVTGRYSGYGSAIDKFDKHYPQRPIHHTLMSLNIFRSDIYNRILAVQSLGTLYPQMYGMVFNDKLKHEPVIHLPPNQISLRQDTEGFHDKRLYKEVPFRWTEYYTKLRCFFKPYNDGKTLKSALKSDYWPD